MDKIAATVVCALACATLVYAEYRHARPLRAVTKTLASLAFIAVGYFAATRGTDYERHILLGLVLGAVGDVALLGKSSRAFLGGLTAFLLGHLAYFVAFIHLVGPGETLGLAGIYAALPIAIGVGVLVWLWPRLGSMRVPVIAYVATIIAMVVAAIAAARSDALPARNRELLVAGAALFFASDLAVARDKFVGAAFVNRAWGLPCYYAGQLLIAWSLS
ncbi:MAG: lysoplasmalogenase [Kofleriaceae bacterium]|nr:lysoplasmalogenase [Kofleriaceae bacterium]